ncbi:MAG: hypothetical protein ACYC7D_00990 [Nitrososphaerales archaeon]
MRTGSVGNRTVEDMVNTLVEPKKKTIQSIRQKLLGQGFSEEVEFDSIEIEPVMIYSKSGKRLIFLKHKWVTVALVIVDKNKVEKFSKLGLSLAKLETNAQDGATWLKFELPGEEGDALNALSVSSIE